MNVVVRGYGPLRNRCCPTVAEIAFGPGAGGLWAGDGRPLAPGPTVSGRQVFYEGSQPILN